MKSLLTTSYFCLFCISLSWGQSENRSREFSYTMQNGISSQAGDAEPNKVYVNALRFQMTLNNSKKYNSIIGLQYGKNGNALDWVCGTSWDYCQTFGIPPIDVKAKELKHYLSILFNSRYTFSKQFYFQGGPSLDFPFLNSSNYKYKSSDGAKSKSRDIDVHGSNMLFNTSFGANLIFGKKIPILKNRDLIFEFEYKMYNLLAIRFEDYEYYFFSKNQKPWVVGFNIGISINKIKN